MPPPPLLSHPHFLPDTLFAALLISLSLDISVTLRMPVSLPSPSRSLLFFTLVSTCLSFLPVDLREVPPLRGKEVSQSHRGAYSPAGPLNWASQEALLGSQGKDRERAYSRGILKTTRFVLY